MAAESINVAAELEKVAAKPEKFIIARAVKIAKAL